MPKMALNQNNTVWELKEENELISEKNNKIITWTRA